MTNDTAITALQHIAAGHDAVCTACGWMGPINQTENKVCVLPLYLCPECGGCNICGEADEIAAYALRQIEGGGE